MSLAQGHNAVALRRLEPTTSRVRATALPQLKSTVLKLFCQDILSDAHSKVGNFINRTASSVYGG